jgi:hypothetical protein
MTLLGICLPKQYMGAVNDAEKEIKKYLKRLTIKQKKIILMLVKEFAKQNQQIKSAK